MNVAMDETEIQELLGDQETLPSIMTPRECAQCGTLMCPDTTDGHISFVCLNCPTPE